MESQPPFKPNPTGTQSPWPISPGTQSPWPIRQVEAIASPLPDRAPNASAPSMTIGDVYYALFRHKGKILLCSVMGLLAAAVYYLYFPPPFQSEAKLFVRYVVNESKTFGPTSDASNTKSPDMRGETIMDSEEQILTSLDLSNQVAEAIGPGKILARLGGGSDVNQAALVLNQGLLVEIPRNSSVIRVVFRHPDPEIVQPVLTEITDRYLKMHVDIHRAVGIIGDFLTQETDQLRNRLAQTEDELRKARNKAGVVSLDESKKNYAEELSRIRAELFSAQAELAERASIYNELTKKSPDAPVTAEAPPVPLTSEKIDEYRGALGRIEQLKRREQDLLTQFTEENSRVKEVRSNLAEAEMARKKLEEESPGLTRAVMPPVGQTQATPQRGTIDLVSESTRLVALQAKIKVLIAQLEQIRAEAANVDKEEGSILELLRKKELEEANYRYYAARLEQARINEALGNGKVSNISKIQLPSPPMRDRKKSFQIIGGLAGGGIALGIAWAFMIEMLLDRSVRRPIDVERMFGLPLFLSIPALGKKNKLRKAKVAENAPKAAPPTPPGAATAPTTGALIVRGDAELARLENAVLLHTYHETLRDRLIGYFESRNLTHKPKLVAVTGLDRGSGVTTTAAGLASCLSETGEGNVLLVDMTAGQGSAQQFYRGKKSCGLDEILDERESAQVQDKLYVVAESPGRDRLSRILPQRFTKLVPQLKASNFDYIIFDMPPVSQISITPRLAGFMDMVLLVIESEKTDQDLVQRATALLAQSKSHVGAVLNKTRNYVPKQLHQDNLGNL